MKRVFEPQPKIRVGHRIIVPSIAGWRRERVSNLATSDVVPDWACIMLSPDDEIGGVVNECARRPRAHARTI